MQFASNKKPKKDIESEFEIRMKIGFPFELVDAAFT